MTKKQTGTKTVKTSRVSETRVKNERPAVWTPPSSLDDTQNVSGKMRSGWEFVRADEYPNDNYPSVDTGKYAGMIGVGGLVLARIPEEIAKSREAYFNNLTAERNEAVNNDLMKEQHPSMPINNDRQTRVTFGGSKD